MEKPYTKEQLLKMINIVDNYLMEAKEFFDKYSGWEIPEEYIENYNAMLKEVIEMINLRKLFQKDLLENHGIFVMNGWEL